MPLESGTYISDLNASNPLGVGDPKAQGDDHIRLIKSTLKNTFPNLSAAMTADATELNNLDGVTGKTGTGNLVLSASPTLTGTLAAAAITASGTITGNLFSGSGASLTNLPAANLTGTLPAISGANLTSLNATQLTSGTVADARLSTNVALLNGTTTFTTDQTITKATARLMLDSSGSTNATIRFNTGGSTRGFIGADGGSAAVAGAAAGDLIIRAEAGGLRFSGDGGSTAHFALSAAGVLSTPGASAAEVGTSGVVARAISASNSTVATDCGKCILFNGGSGQTFTLDADPPVNSVVVLVNESGNNWTIAASGSLIYAGVTGSRTLPTGCMAVAYNRQGSGIWQIAGQLL